MLCVFTMNGEIRRLLAWFPIRNSVTDARERQLWKGGHLYSETQTSYAVSGLVMQMNPSAQNAAGPLYLTCHKRLSLYTHRGLPSA